MAGKMKGRRMICKEIYESYEFLSLLNDTDCRLYTYLCLNTDDDGVVEALRVMRMINSPNSSLEKLIELDFVKLLDNRDTLYITNFHRFNSFRDKRWLKPSPYRELLVKVLPEVKKELFDASNNVASEDDAKNSGETRENLRSSTGETRENLRSSSGETLAITTTKTTTKNKTRNESITTTKEGRIGGNVVGVNRNDINEYIKKCNYKNVNGDMFFNFYRERDWTCNGEEIRDWKILIDLWERNPKSIMERHDYDFDELEKEIVSNNP